MNKTLAAETSTLPVTRTWSNRILIAALAGIFFLTLYPFEFSLHTKLPPGASPFFLGKAGKGGGPRDIALNILLFMPFGFALAAKLRSKGKSWPVTLLCAWIAGAVVSYGIEFLQIYIPARDSGWEDVFSNSTGSVVGFLAFRLFGRTISKLLSRFERSAEAWLTVPRIALILLAYLMSWTLYSIPLQKQTHLGNWSPDCFLVFGNDATGRHPWKGKLSRIEIWDRSVGKDFAKNLTLNNDLSPDDEVALAKFDFSSTPPRQDNARLSVPLSPASAATMQPEGNEVSFDWGPTIASAQTVPDLISDLQRTNQFAIRVLFEPEEIADSSGRIMSISQPSGFSDLYLRQENANLVFWFRIQFSGERPAFAWTISNVLTPGQTRDFLFSYDGSYLRLYVDGREIQDRYLGPGTAFAELFRHAKQAELNGYKDIYYAVVFIPIGCLLGIAARKVPFKSLGALIAFSLSLVLGPVLLEYVLARVDGRSLSITDLTLSTALVLAGTLWINSDRRTRRFKHAGSHVRP